MEPDNIHNKIKELLGKAPDKLAIIEDQIPLEVQMHYFETSKKYKNHIDKAETLEMANLLFVPEVPLEEKKILLAKLSSIEEPEAFRFIEKYLKSAEPENIHWAKLALLECRMLLESSLLEQNQILISSGLGGKNGKLRYFIVIFLKEGYLMDETRKLIVNNEFEPILSKQDCEIENIKFQKNFFTMSVLIPMDVSIKDAFSNAINESNQYGEFLIENFIVTNVKRLTFSEIKNLLNKKFEIDE